ncbi:beta-crystallin S-1-like [Sinocyclocheilus rhinocerous]|uniref:Beta-crystallin S-1-like n=1 Tax=Sinocyclocheilus rhinocerous TaxID=307959 RepID=A0A673KQI6_9TELE|nr:PREDICTED: beta-crystallin S-1-like [Sinocyclocheilus rhinocerous]
MTTESIVFYEDRNFKGRSYVCKGDTSDLHSFFSQCNSAKVKGGFWVLYERPNYMGYQYILVPGEYPDYHHWIGFNDCVRSCRLLRHVTGHLKLKFFERPNFDGKTWEVTESTPSLQEHFLCREIHSCKVQEGPCVFFEHANYRGHQYLLEKGEYRRHTEWGAMHATVGSIRQITTDC